MRILHVIPTLRGGGAERQLAYLSAGLGALGCEVHVALLDGGTNLPRLQATGATVHTIPAAGNYDPRILFRLVRLMRRLRPDVVQTWITQMDVLGGAAALITRTPWVLSERSNPTRYDPTRRDRIRHFLGRFAGAIVANSEQGLAAWGNLRTSRLVIRNGIAFDEIDRAEPDRTVAPGRRVILYAGRMDPQKNVLGLVAVLQEIVRERDVVALLCGVGPLEGEIRDAIERSGVSDRLLMLGFREDLFSLMKRADVIIVPSFYEGHPNVTIEAAAARCPLVVSDIPEHRSWLNEESALFAAPEDRRALASAILQSLDDPAAARKRAEAARETVSSWSIERAASAYMAIYTDLARSKS